MYSFVFACGVAAVDLAEVREAGGVVKGGLVLPVADVVGHGQGAGVGGQAPNLPGLVEGCAVGHGGTGIEKGQSDIVWYQNPSTSSWLSCHRDM